MQGRGPAVKTRPGLLERLALHRPELRAWALYDWANSAVFTVVITAVFPIFFADVAAQGFDADTTRRVYGWATTLSLLVAAFLAPVLGAIADYARVKKAFFAAFLALGVLGTAGMFWIGPGDWRLACWLFGAVNLGAAGSFVFYDAMLSTVAREDEMDRLSTTGYAVGYLGGGLCLGLVLLLVSQPAWFGIVIAPDADAAARSLPARIGFLVVALWWIGFTIPYFRRVPEPPLALEHDEERGQNPVRIAFQRLGETFRALRTYKQAFLFLVAFLAFNDGIGTVIRMAAILGEERAIPRGVMMLCILLVQFLGIFFAVVFGRVAGAIGPKKAILIALGVYVVICVLGYRLATPGEFIAIAVLVAMVQGGAQALSRSLFASLVPRHKSGEFFGLFSTLEKFSGVLGPLVFSLAPSTGSAILSTIAFFVLGGALLLFVDVEAGRRAAREAERRLVQASDAGAAS